MSVHVAGGSWCVNMSWSGVFVACKGVFVCVQAAGGGAAGQMKMDIGEQLQLYDKPEESRKTAHVSVIRSTQQTHFKKISLIVCA